MLSDQKPLVTLCNQKNHHLFLHNLMLVCFAVFHTNLINAFQHGEAEHDEAYGNYGGKRSFVFHGIS
jgi:hypothetical protein